MNQIGAVILAAGEGKRMKSSTAKVLHPVLEKPMIDWVLDAASGAGVEKFCVVTGYAHEQVEAHVKKRAQVRTVLQQPRLGTAHALMQAKEFLSECAGTQVLVMAGDSPFLSAQTIKGALAWHKQQGYAATILTAKVADPAGYGRILRKDGLVAGIIEEKDANSEQKQICEINSSAYWFDAEKLLSVLDQIGNDNAQKEYLLTDAIALLIGAGHPVGAFTAECADEVAGANDRYQLCLLGEIARKAIIRRHMANGVSFESLDGIFIGPDVAIGADSTVLSGCRLFGRTRIGSGCVVGPNSTMYDVCLGDGSTFQYAYGVEARVGAHTAIGPYVQLRPNSVLGDHMRVGNFVEVKNSTLGDGTKVSHLTYVGDSDVGENVNFGCGTVTVNYDGKGKYRTTIGDHVFIGCNTNLVAPVKVADHAYTAAGSTITDDVEAYDLAIARARQVNKASWVRKREEKA